MYIVVIGWLYVVLLMALTAKSFSQGLILFLVWGVLPIASLLWLMGRRLRKVARQSLHAQDGGHPEGNQ
jgi:biotin transporter BioY